MRNVNMQSFPEELCEKATSLRVEKESPIKRSALIACIMKKFEENYMTSLEAKTNALKASMENLATTVVSDDMYAGFLDGAKAVPIL